MTGFKLIAPPSDRGPVITIFVSIVAVLAGAFILSSFVDALHLSIERGETMRAAHRVVPPASFDVDKPVLMAMASQRNVSP